MNQTIETILNRRSVRDYQNKPVPREALEQIVECGLFAATALGKQPWHLTVVTNRAVLDDISRVNRRLLLEAGNEMGKDEAFDNFRGAPCAIVLSGEEGNPFSDIDCANATENMALAAWSMGIASCYIASFRPAFSAEEAPELRAKLGIPDGYRPTLALALGYARELPTERAPRRDGTVHFVP